MSFNSAVLRGEPAERRVRPRVGRGLRLDLDHPVAGRVETERRLFEAGLAGKGLLVLAAQVEHQAGSPVVLVVG